MEIFYVDNLPSLHVDWEVTRGRTSVREDMSQAEVWAFLTSENGLLPLSVEKVDNTLQCDIPTGLEVGVYGIKAIWVKNGTGSQTLDELLACNKRCVSEVFELFGVSASQYADTNPNGDITFHIKSSVATYGYDGLSAYEKAYMLGKTTLSESEWLNGLEKAVDYSSQMAVVRGTGNYSAVQLGTATAATGASSFCEGAVNKAGGTCSHCGGNLCQAKADCSHVSGFSCASNEEATGSICHGSHLTTKNPNEAGFGTYNDSHTGDNKASCTLFSVGKGNGTLGRSNALEIMQDGTIKIWLDQQYISLQDYLINITTPQQNTPAAGDGSDEPFPEERVEPSPEPYPYGSIGTWVGLPVQ